MDGHDIFKVKKGRRTGIVICDLHNSSSSIGCADCIIDQMERQESALKDLAKDLLVADEWLDDLQERFEALVRREYPQ